MHLKRIEIQGFKSFPDNVTVNLSRGITAVVGPNGSGKSNIVDAVRWVLGEQSTKTLRGGKMEDVIFSGTSHRAPSVYCQVSLTIDNAEGILPIEYSEITVTRRYYRSGESEFYINKKQVRLKDVHELFMDTGLGRDGYSIIGQGRIDEILSVRSGDRRELFEEAAGITKFRFRKEEAEKKLGLTEENLVRLRDIVSELENSLEPLKAQAEKTKRYLLLRDEMRSLETALWLINIDKLEKAAKKTAVDCENALRMLSAKKSELSAVYADADGLFEKMRSKDTEIDELRKKKADLASDAASIASNAAVHSANIENLKDNIRDIERQLDKDKAKEDDFLTRTRELDEKLSHLNEENTQLDERLRQLSEKAARENEKNTAVLKRIEDISEAMSCLAREKSVAETELALVRKNIEDTLHLGESDKVRLAQTEYELIKSRQRLSEYEKETKEQLDKKQEAQNVLSGFELVFANKEEKLRLVKSELENNQRQKHAKEDRLSLLKAMAKDYEGFNRAVKTVMDASERGFLPNICGTVAQLIRTDDEYTAAIETALGGALQNIVVETEEDGKRAIGYLKSRDGGRATFLPITAIRGRETGDIFKSEPGYVGMAHSLVLRDERYSDIVKSLLGSTLAVDNIDNAIKISRRHRGKVRIVTLDGQIINSSGSMTGGSLGKNTGVLARANETEKLEEQLLDITKVIEKGKTEVMQAESAVKSMRFSMDGATAALHEADIELSRLTAKTQGERANIDRLGGDMKVLRERTSELDGKVKSMGEEAVKTEKTISDLDEKYREKKDELDRINTEQAEKNAFLSEISRDMAAVNERIAAIASEKSLTLDMKGQIDELKESIVFDLDSRKAGIEAIKGKLTLAQGLLDKAREDEKNIRLKEEDISRKIAKTAQEKMSLEGRRSELDKRTQAINNALLNLERESARLESKKENEILQRQSFLDKMWDTYELSPLSARQCAQRIDDVAESSRRLAKIKNEIKSIGSVNVLAVEEYEKANERYVFIKTQKDDLEKAKSDILKVIYDLTKNMQGMFKSQFDLINKSFSDTFAEIFGGGSAYLQLEDEKDILNCGIEIKVTLPGKTVKTISLLSGGEKAFVAIALYFAILKVRPTPFCIVDEIDAALDDVNVEKYISYMRTLCGRTQFIAVTHRRGTMEGADILYGVAMQESGVSKLLTINVNDIEEQIKINENNIN